MLIKDVTDLEVYNLSMELLKELYLFLRKIPLSEYDSVKQCKRASKSIPANIAEGFAKKQYNLEFKRYLKIAIGSSDEIVTHLRTVAIAVPQLETEAMFLGGKYKVLSKRLMSLHKNWSINFH